VDRAFEVSGDELPYDRVLGALNLVPRSLQHDPALIDHGDQVGYGKYLSR